MSIQKQIVLRYRSRGHVRFDMPPVLREPAIVRALVGELSRIEGVRQVDFYLRRGKLSIRYAESVCGFPVLARQLAALVERLQDGKGLAPAAPPAGAGLRAKMSQVGPVRWLREKYTEAQETVTAMTILARIGMKKPSAFVKDREKTVIHFLNDVLVLYLVKRHWHLITNHWLLHPIRYRYEWLTVFYLFYLLVRSRLPEK